MPTGAIRRLHTQQHTRKHHENRHLERQFPQRPPAPSTKLAGRPPSRHPRLTRTQTRPRQIPGRRPANDGLALRLERPKNLQRRRHHQPPRTARRTLRPARPPRRPATPRHCRHHQRRARHQRLLRQRRSTGQPKIPIQRTMVCRTNRVRPHRNGRTPQTRPTRRLQHRPGRCRLLRPREMARKNPLFLHRKTMV